MLGGQTGDQTPFVKSSPDAGDEHSSTTQRSQHAVGMKMTTLHCLARPTKSTRERLQGVLPQACVERDDGGRRDVQEPSITEARLPEHPEHTQTSRETCGDYAGRGAVAWAGGWATCDEFEVRHSKNKASDNCGRLVVRRH